MDDDNSDVVDSVQAADDSKRAGSGDYATRLATEISTYQECADVHALPPIFKYWSERYLRPVFLQFGFGSPDEMFAKYLAEMCASSSGISRFVSLGSGNSLIEVGIASQLVKKGYSQFVIECFDVNSKMLERGAAAAEDTGVSGHVVFHQGDLNGWTPSGEYDAIMANQSLHHVVCLETLFDRVKDALKADGSFLISDMIGRNGHQRWPEALSIVHEFWRKLPPSYRYNRSLKRYEELYENWDCSLEGFEGIRSQDILPLLLERFQFRLFWGFGNIIDPFVDRAFGPNFDATAAWDRSFIDEVHFRDQQCLRSGSIKPTHMIAIVGKNAAERTAIYESMTPESCVRAPLDIQVTSDERNNGSASLEDLYDWTAWPHNLQRELEFAHRMFAERGQQLVEMKKQIEEQRTRMLQLEQEFEQRTAWALRLDEEVNIRGKQILALQRYMDDPLRYAKRWVSIVSKRIKGVFGMGI